MTDLAVIVVSTNEAHWLRRCLPTIYEHAGKIELDVVVVDNESTDETRELVESEFPRARVVRCVNRGFAQANNCALRTLDARWVLFLNPDTEILDGTLAGLVDGLGARPTVGLVGVRQVTPDGQLYPTIRRFSTATRWFFEAIGSERFPFKASWLGERELDMSVYEQDVECDWVSGSFMLVRREALQSAGFMDERFFLFCDETDLCLRIKQAGWEVRHLPDLTILHHAGKAGWNPKLEAQGAYAKRLYLQKHFSPPHRLAATAALALGYGLRSVAWPSERERRECCTRGPRHSSRSSTASLTASHRALRFVPNRRSVGCRRPLSQSQSSTGTPAKLVLACLALPESVAGVAYEAVVVGSASIDGSGDALGQRPEITLIRNTRNLGYAAEVNRPTDDRAATSCFCSTQMSISPPVPDDLVRPEVTVVLHRQ